MTFVRGIKVVFSCTISDSQNELLCFCIAIFKQLLTYLSRNWRSWKFVLWTTWSSDISIAI